MAFRTADLLSLTMRTGDATSQHIFDLTRFLQAEGIRAQLYSNYAPGPLPEEIRPLVRQADYADYQPSSDLLILEYSNWSPLAERIRDHQGAKIFSYHGVTPPALWGSEAGREGLRIAEVRTQLAWFAHLALTVSPYMREELHRNSGYPLERIRVVPFGLPLDHLQTPPTPTQLEALRARWGVQGKRVVLFIGRVAGNKRIDLAVSAVARLVALDPQVHLLVVGNKDGNPAERELAANLVAQAEQLGIANQVTLTGRVDQVEPYYHLADVLVLPSLHEGFGVPLVEAMAVGLPTVASASCALPWVLDAEAGEEQAAGLLFAPGDDADLARQIGRIWQEPGLRAGLIERGKARAARFSPAQFAANMRAVLAEVATLAQSPTPAEQHPMGQLYQQADVALRNYKVRSGVPLVGRLIEWVRRNSTTHVKEAYLDPMIEQQVNFNRQVADEILHLQGEVRRLQAEIDQLRKEQAQR